MMHNAGRDMMAGRPARDSMLSRVSTIPPLAASKAKPHEWLTWCWDLMSNHEMGWHEKWFEYGLT
jgi:hypothetical protein